MLTDKLKTKPLAVIKIFYLLMFRDSVSIVLLGPFNILFI